MRICSGFQLVGGLGVLVIAAATAPAAAALTDLVVNGEFENPQITGFAFPTVVPGWTSSKGSFEFWEGGFLDSPDAGSDGELTGQHMEMDANFMPTYSQSFVVPALNSNEATFSFDAWLRTPGLSQYRVDGSVSGVLVDTTSILSNHIAWTSNAHVLSVNAGETITISFLQQESDGDSGSHIDQVEFIVDAAAACPGDVDDSDSVDFTDLNIVLDHWGETVDPGTSGDANSDGTVNFAGLNLVLDYWGTDC